MMTLGNIRHHFKFIVARSGFTLIEALVVLVIILILAAILFPVLAGRPKHHGNRASCQSHLKQIGLGIIQYTQDYNERFPLNLGGGEPMLTTPANMLPREVFVVTLESGTTGHYQTWMDLIYPYTKSTQILRCPVKDRDSSPYPSYGYSVGLGGHGAARSQLGKDNQMFSQAKLEEVQRPAEVIMLSDFNAPDSYSMTPGDLQRYAASANSGVVAPHLDGSNIAYTDGHVKWNKRELFAQFATGTNACDLKKPNKSSQFCEKAFNPFLP